jgi:NNP family nitrate/nitrite transporter-like MFS transporter
MVPLLAVSMICLGLGNGAVFQIVPQRFSRDIGAVTGTIGAVGGLGGFFLPMLLGSVKQLTGSFTPGFMALSLVAASAAISLRVLLAPRGRWHASVARVEAAE